MARRAYCVETSQISLADATLSDVRGHDELRPERDGNGQGMVKWDIRIVFHKAWFCKNVPNGPGFDRELSSRHASFEKCRSRTEP